MDFETEKICFNQFICEKKDSFFAEENLIIPDIKPDILSTVDTSGTVYIYKKELVNGKLKIDGGIQTYIMYLADDEQNNLRGIHTVIDFSKTIDLDVDNENLDFKCNINLESIECKILNGRKISVKATIGLKILLYSNEEKEYVRSLNNVEKIQMISDSKRICCLKGKGETVKNGKNPISKSC